MLFAVLFMGNACTAVPDVEPQVPTKLNANETSDIVSVLKSDGRFSSFVTAVEDANLDEELATDGPFTVFVPIPADGSSQNGKSESISVEDHVAAGTILSADLEHITGFLVMQSGNSIGVSGNGQHVLLSEDVRLVQSDIRVANGVIHLIEKPLFP